MSPWPFLNYRPQLILCNKIQNKNKIFLHKLNIKQLPNY